MEHEPYNRFAHARQNLIEMMLKAGWISKAQVHDKEFGNMPGFTMTVDWTREGRLKKEQLKALLEELEGGQVRIQADELDALRGIIET